MPRRCQSLPTLFSRPSTKRNHHVTQRESAACQVGGSATVPHDERPPADDDPADHVSRLREREEARAKLLALAGALAGPRLRHRLLERGLEEVPLLRVWDARRQHLAETVSCQRLPEGWRFISHPSGPVLAEADVITEPADATEAARLVAARITRTRRTR
jgi:hypothetical protein